MRLCKFIGFAIVVMVSALCFSATAYAQNGFGRPTNIRVQLPVVSVFNVRTVVSVPDGGTMSLGGVSRHSSGRTSRGVPGFGGPLFQGRGIGYSSGRNQATVKATIISNREINDALMADGNRRFAARQQTGINGAPAVQAKADFITRNIGRSRR
jgi:type II secretory pathway component GspD/PulD (secretin)